MTRAETLCWILVGIVITVLTASYPREVRIIIEKIPQGFRAVRIALLTFRLWKFKKTTAELERMSINDKLIMLWWAIITTAANIMVFTYSRDQAVKQAAIGGQCGGLIIMGIGVLISSFRVAMSEVIVKRTRAKLKKYGIEDTD